MKLHQRTHPAQEDQARPVPDEAPEPQPEQEERRLEDPDPSDLSKRDFRAIFVRAFKRFNEDHMTSVAAALAYYAFLAIPSALLLAVGTFGLVAGPGAIATVIDKLNHVAPSQATSLLKGSLEHMTQQRGTSITVLGVGLVLAVWSLTGAMQNVMWGVNIAYTREETRGFIRRRVVALAMVLFTLIGFVLSFGVLVLGPHVARWIGDAMRAKSIVEITWWVAEWPLLVLGLLVTFAGIMYFAPNIKHPRWTFLSFGSAVALAIWLLGSGLFTVYVSMFSSYNKAWGSLSAVVVMLTWLWLSSVALLLGAEVNAEAERSRELRRGEPAEIELQAPAKA